MIYGGYFDVASKEKEIDDLTKLTNDVNFWNDDANTKKVFSKLNSLKNIVDPIVNIKKEIINDLELLEIIDEDSEELIGLNDDYKKLNDEMSLLSNFLLLNGKYDSSNCILEIHSGAGGTEACDWAYMLYRMYSRWCEKKGYKIIIMDYQEGDTTGIKSCSLEIDGESAYGYLKGEKGVHRLVRLSPFDSNNRRHTSFASILVTPVLQDVSDINIDDKDLKIDVYRSSGNGGQGVNTTDSAVRITHLPTGIVVTCQNERSQIQNKEQALRVLKNKLLLIKLEEQEKELNKIKGEQSNIEFGSQIRSYVMHPYSMVKDHRTGYETSDVNRILDGDIQNFITEALKQRVS